ncbi:CapA family protein [Actinomycetaceae bacterium MB13-C1-2]|nr:CapA family protein [Actinomycetaceae bacterium MB13-C1-2]
MTQTKSGGLRPLLIILIVASLLALVGGGVWMLLRGGVETQPDGGIAATQSGQQSEADPLPEPQSEPAVAPEPELAPVDFTIAAGGDILLHNTVFWASQEADGRYNLSRLLSTTAAYVEGADLALCQMEVPIAQAGQEPSNYPLFAAPYETAEELKEAGWDGCSTASNHSVDWGFAGLTNTLDRFDEAGLGHAGTARSAEELQAPQYYEIEKDGQTLTVAHISFANNLNGMEIPAEAPWSINLNDIQMVLEQAKQARDDGADLVIVSYHCCAVEYTSIPEDLQVSTAQALGESGLVDIMISHHAHVPKPIDRVPGGPNGDGMWVAYGTGNFISDQDENCCVPESNVGVLVFFEVQKAADGVVTVPDASWSAVMTERKYGYYTRVITADGAADSPVPLDEIQWRHQMVADVMSEGLGSERGGPPVEPGVTTVVVQ